MNGDRLGRRLGRILVMLPYVIRNPGVTLAELATKLGVAASDVRKDLDLVFMCGLPGYGPGDLIDVTLQDDRVYVSMADYFAAPLRVTPAEGLVLYSGGAALAELPGMEGAEALRRALSKLGRALGAGTDLAPALDVKLGTGRGTHLGVLQDALARRRRVEMEYRSTTRGELTRRKVDPWGLVAALGRWYLIAWDHLSGDERMFRTDRIKSAEVLDEAAAVPDDFDPEPYRRAFRARAGQTTVSFEIAPAAAAWFEDYYPLMASRVLPDGWTRVELVSGGPRWAALLVLRLGGEVRNVAPRSVVVEARDLARAIAARHA